IEPTRYSSGSATRTPWVASAASARSGACAVDHARVRTQRRAMPWPPIPPARTCRALGMRTERGSELARRIIVVGAGVSGLSAAFELTRRGAEAEIIVLESSERWGGNIRTLRQRGCVADAGPDALLMTRPEALALTDALGLSDRLITVSNSARRVLVARGEQ